MTWLRRIPNTTLIDWEKIDNLPTDTNASLAAKQDTLVSWKNIKTVGWKSLLGSGDINISLTGDVIWPATNTDSYIPQRDWVNTKTLKNWLAVPQGWLAGLTALWNKVEKNAPIAGATKTKITYDAKWLVTGWEDATTADIADSTDKRYVTDAQLTVIGNTSWTNSWDEDVTSIKTKLWAADTDSDWYLTSTDWNTFNAKQAALVSGTNIKTVWGTTLLWSGDIDWWTGNIGYKNIPQVSKSANYTLVLWDAGKSIDHPSSDANARTFTIPANSSVAYPVGTTISFSNMSSQEVTIAITTDTMYLAWDGATGSRTLAQYGVATIRKLTATTRLISWVWLT